MKHTQKTIRIVGGKAYKLLVFLCISLGFEAMAAASSHVSWVGEGSEGEGSIRWTAIEENRVEAYLEEGHSSKYFIEVSGVRGVGFKNGKVKRPLVGQAALMGQEEAVIELLKDLSAEDLETQGIVSWTENLGYFVNKVALRGKVGRLRDYFQEEAYSILKEVLGRTKGEFSLGHVLAYHGMDRAFSLWMEKGGDVNPRGIIDSEEIKHLPISWMVYWGEGGGEDKRYAILRQLQASFEERSISLEEEKALFINPFARIYLKGGRSFDILPSYEGIKRTKQSRVAVVLGKTLLLTPSESSSSSSSHDVTSAEFPDEFTVSEYLNIIDAGGRSPLHWVFVDEREAEVFGLIRALSVEKERFQEALEMPDNEGMTPWHLALMHLSPAFLKRLWGYHEEVSSEKVEAWINKTLNDKEEKILTESFLSHSLPMKLHIPGGVVPSTAAASSSASSSSSAASGAGGSSVREAPLLHEAFFCQTESKFRAFKESFRGLMGSTDEDGETVFHKVARRYEGATAEDKELLFRKFRFALRNVSLADVDPTLGQGALLHSGVSPSVSTVWTLLDMEGGFEEGDLLRSYVQELGEAYQSKVKERTEKESRAEIARDKRLEVFDDAFYGMSQSLYTAHQVLATGMVSREETGAEQTVGYIEVVGEMIPVPGAAVIGRIITAAGKGYLRSKEEGRIEGIAGRYVRANFEKLSQEMTLALEEPLRGLTEKSAETVGEVLGTWFMTRETRATEFEYIEGFIVDLLAGEGPFFNFIDRWSTPLLIEHRESGGVSVKRWVEALGIRDETSNEWRRKGTTPKGYIRGKEELATALGFEDEHGRAATRTIQKGKEDEEGTTAGVAGVLAGVEQAAHETEARRLAQDLGRGIRQQGGCCVVQ